MPRSKHARRAERPFPRFGIGERRRPPAVQSRAPEAPRLARRLWRLCITGVCDCRRFRASER
eukprot:5345201-Alexandrium_andersonii.AAC.1